jgi:DNA repair exonuclease SbcCD ATPase subunit
MSLFAKIMVIVNLILAVAFLAAAGTFLNATQSWKVKHDEVKTTLETRVADVEAQRDAQAKEKEAALAGKRSADTLKAEFQGKVETAQASMAELHQLNENLRQNLETFGTNQADMQSRLTELSTEIDRLRGDLETAESAKKDALETVKTLQEEVARLEQGVADAEATAAAGEAANMSLRDQLDQTATELAGYKGRYPAPSGVVSMKKIDATVQASDNEMDIYILSVGSADGVTEGYEFHVYRGSTYVATVMVDRVFPNHCSTHVKHHLKKSPIQAGDSASTYL